MMNSSSSSSPSSQPASRHNRFGWAIMLASLLGLADTAYLSIAHFMGTGVECSITHGCEQVLGSEYAVIQGVPVSLIGLLYYAFVFLFAYYFGLTAQERFRQAYSAVVCIGLLVTAYLTYLQIFVIGAICQFCMVSAALTVILAFSVGLEAIRTRHPSQNED